MRSREALGLCGCLGAYLVRLTKRRFNEPSPPRKERGKEVLDWSWEKGRQAHLIPGKHKNLSEGGVLINYSGCSHLIIERCCIMKRWRRRLSGRMDTRPGSALIALRVGPEHIPIPVITRHRSTLRIAAASLYATAASGVHTRHRSNSLFPRSTPRHLSRRCGSRTRCGRVHRQT